MSNLSNNDAVVHGSELVLDMIFAATQALPVTTAILVSGKSLSQPDVLKLVEATRAPMKDVRSTRDAYKAALKAARKSEREVVEVIRQLRVGFTALLGDESPELKKFGFKPHRKPRALTPEEKVLASEKARRTRELRHTLGRKAKEAIKATDVAPVVLPRPGPATPAAPATPGTSAGPTRIPA